MLSPLIRQTMAITAVVVSFLLPSRLRADSLVDWNEVAVQSILTVFATGVPPRPAPTIVLDMAMVREFSASLHETR
jgi:hypothetical protein